MKTTCVLALMVLVSAAGAGAADKNKSDDDKTAAAADHKSKSATDPDKVICHTDMTTGSRTRINRVCHTRAQWAEIDEQTRRGLNDLSRNAGQTGADKGPFSPN